MAAASNTGRRPPEQVPVEDRSENNGRRRGGRDAKSSSPPFGSRPEGGKQDQERVMLNGTGQATKTKVVVLTTDDDFEQSARATFSTSGAIELMVDRGGMAGHGHLDLDGNSVVIADLDATSGDDFSGLQRLVAQMGARPAVVVVTQAFNETVARQLLQVRVADFLI